MPCYEVPCLELEIIRCKTIMMLGLAILFQATAVRRESCPEPQFLSDRTDEPWAGRGGCRADIRLPVAADAILVWGIPQKPSRRTSEN